MVHPDYQYTPKLITAMASLRLLTFFQNLLLAHKLPEYHTGYRVKISIKYRLNKWGWISSKEFRQIKRATS